MGKLCFAKKYKGGDAELTTEIVVLVVGLCSSISGILFAALGHRRNERKDTKKSGETEGSLVSDVTHIKQSIDRIECDVRSLDERQHYFTERIAKVEEGLSNIEKRIDEINKKGW